MNNLLTYRDKFSSLSNCHYLISNSLGAMPDAARDYGQRYFDTWANRGVRSWEEEWWGLSRVVGDKIGRLLNAAPDTVSMHANVTSASATILSALNFQTSRKKIVMIDMEFPSILYLYREWADRHGAKVEIVPCRNGVTAPIDQICDTIDENTLIVPISHVLFRSSYIVDAKKIIEKAHSVGALVALDVFQSLGTIPVDIRALGVDFAVGGCLKWLCGGPGACFLYVRPDLAPELKPHFTGWLAHRTPFDFDNIHMDYTDGSYRCLNGTPVVPALYTCQAGLDIVTEVGPARIRARSMEMTARLLDHATARNWKTTTPGDPSLRAGTVAFDIPNANAIAAELCARDFLVDYRPKAGIRISPHFYNTNVEIDDVVDEIEKIIGDRSFTRHEIHVGA